MSLREPRKSRDPRRGGFVQRAERTANLTVAHRRAPKQEREVAARLGGRPTAASGAKDVKGDVRIKGVARVECKTTRHKSFAVTLAMVGKLEESALLAGEVPAIVVEFIDADGRRLAELAVVPTYVLDGLRA